MTGKRIKPIAFAALAGIMIVGLSAALAGKCGKKTEKDVTIDQVPAAVKATIEKEAGDNKIEEIEEVSKDRKVVYYEAEWKTGGKEIEIKVDPSGKLLSKEVEDDDDDD